MSCLYASWWAFTIDIFRSSSLEVLASLAFDDSSFLEHMCEQRDGTMPAFYQNYVAQVQRTIQNNARLEFEAIWREHELTGEPRSILSDKLSVAITTLDEELQRTELWDDMHLRRSVLSEALPNLLLEKVGLDKILQRVSGFLLRPVPFILMLTATGSGLVPPGHLWVLS